MTTESKASPVPPYPLVTLIRARELTGLELISARDIGPEWGQSFHDMEEESESRSHRSAREAAISFFCSVGYQVFPEGIGIRGTYTLADFLAIRENRAVFVEVLSDTNIRPEVLLRKAQLQRHGELCFVLFSGTTRSNEPNLLVAKRSIGAWADVLYCRLDGFGGNRIEHTYKATVAYETTRRNGIRVALALERSGRKLSISAKFLTHLYRNAVNTPISYTVLPVSYCYEEVFLDLFEQWAHRTGGEVKFTSRRRSVTAFRAMRRKSGLTMIDADGHVAARLKSEYRGTPVEDHYAWTHRPSSRDLPPDDIFGVFVLERTGPDGLRSLMKVMEEYGLTLQYSSAELEQGL